MKIFSCLKWLLLFLALLFTLFWVLYLNGLSLVFDPEMMAQIEVFKCLGAELLAMDVDSLRCVGCGHCIDICPTNTLAYQTKFLAKVVRPSLEEIFVNVNGIELQKMQSEQPAKAGQDRKQSD